METRDEQRRKVLLVDDEENLRTLVHETLDETSYTIHQASDGEEALRLAAEHRPDLIILDWMMPGCSGVEVARQIRQQEWTAGTRILLLTAKSQAADKELAMASGVDGYIVKPFSPLNLLDQVEALLER